LEKCEIQHGSSNPKPCFEHSLVDLMMGEGFRNPNIPIVPSEVALKPAEIRHFFVMIAG